MNRSSRDHAWENIRETQAQTLTHTAVEGGHPFLNAVGWRGKVWLEPSLGTVRSDRQMWGRETDDDA
ncbi:MAG: hypothetical protein QXR26_06185 [Candidatus Caldarchaeum sp.]|uniref:Uncharacterized protein n=1 Tax=Caldiarchaeum subterraneum TaxID=311458 RepID=A0A7C5QR98_CALS0